MEFNSRCGTYHQQLAGYTKAQIPVIYIRSNNRNYIELNLIVAVHAIQNPVFLLRFSLCVCIMFRILATAASHFSLFFLCFHFLLRTIHTNAVTKRHHHHHDRRHHHQVIISLGRSLCLRFLRFLFTKLVIFVWKSLQKLTHTQTRKRDTRKRKHSDVTENSIANETHTIGMNVNCTNEHKTTTMKKIKKNRKERRKWSENKAKIHCAVLLITS